MYLNSPVHPTHLCCFVPILQIVVLLEAIGVLCYYLCSMCNDTLGMILTSWDGRGCGGMLLRHV